MPDQPSPSIYESFNGKIWNMEVNQSGILILEIKNQEEYETSFAAIDLTTHEVLWREVTFDNGWWVSINMIIGHILLLHCFDDDKNPEIKKVIAFDINHKKILWESEQYILVGKTSEGSLLAYDKGDEAKEMIAVNMATGKKNEKKDSFVDVRKSENQLLSLPFHYTEDQDYFTTVNGFFKENMKHEIVGACDYLEYEGLILISYYIYDDKSQTNGGKRLSNNLLMLDANGHERLHVSIDSNLPGIGSETYFIFNKLLIFIDHKKTLVGYEV